MHLLERSAESVDQLLAAVPRMVALLGQAEALVARADRLVDDIDATRARAQEVVDRAAAVTDRAAGVTDRADALMGTLVPLTDRLGRLLDLLGPPLTRLQPVLDRLAETTSPREVDAMVHLIDQLPALADSLETEIFPILNSLETVAPDVHDLLDVTKEFNELLGQIPGLRGLKRRVDEQQEHDDRG